MQWLIAHLQQRNNAPKLSRGSFLCCCDIDDAITTIKLYEVVDNTQPQQSWTLKRHQMRVKILGLSNLADAFQYFLVEKCLESPIAGKKTHPAAKYLAPCPS
jgi:hypothetical protein